MIPDRAENIGVDNPEGSPECGDVVNIALFFGVVLVIGVLVGVCLIVKGS